MEGLKRRPQRFYNALRRCQSNNKVRFTQSTTNKANPKDPSSTCRNKAVQHGVLVLSVVASFIGCSFHIWHISDTYFDYDTTTSITIGTYDGFELPAITVCMSLKGSFNKRKWFSRFNTEEIGNHIPAELTIQEIKDMGPDMYWDGIVGFWIRYGLIKFERLDQWRPTVKSIHVEHDLNCETYFLRKMDNSSERYSGQTVIVIEFKYFDEDYVRMVNGSQPNVYRVYVHPPGEKFHINEISVEKEFVEVGARESVGARLTTSTRYYLLQSPYKTNCTNYSEHSPNISNRVDCVYNCIIQKMIRNNFTADDWPYFLPVYMDDTRFNWTNITIHDIGAELGYVYLMHTAFDYFCQDNECAKVDCAQNHVSMKLLYRYDADDVESNENGTTSSLQIQFPAEPTRTYKSHPKVELVEYLSYVAGVLSLWLGISAVGSFTCFGEKCKRLYKPRKHDAHVEP